MRSTGLMARMLGRMMFTGRPTASTVRKALGQMGECDRALFMAGVVDAMNARLSAAADNDERLAVVRSIFCRGGDKRDALRELFANDEHFALFELMHSPATGSVH